MHSNHLQIFAYIYLCRPGADKLPQATEIRPGPAPQPEWRVRVRRQCSLFLHFTPSSSFPFLFCLFSCRLPSLPKVNRPPAEPKKNEKNRPGVRKNRSWNHPFSRPRFLSIFDHFWLPFWPHCSYLFILFGITFSSMNSAWIFLDLFIDFLIGKPEAMCILHSKNNGFSTFTLFWKLAFLMTII